MPDVLASKSEVEREEIAEALAHYLVSQSENMFELRDPPRPADRERGKVLFHSIGCVACHGPQGTLTDQLSMEDHDDEEDEYDDYDDPLAKARRKIKPIAISLEHVAAKYSRQSLSEFLFRPLHVRASGRMPDMKLTPDESQAIASYLMRATTQEAEPLIPRELEAIVPQEPLVALGKKYAQQFNCAACHSLPEIEAAPLLGSLENANLSGGCLSKTDDRSPRFQWEDAQVEAIVAALAENSQEPDTDQVVVAKTLTAFRCTACHTRDEYGGIPEVYDAYFTGSDERLADDGRIPPPLTLVGAKLRPEWMKKVLFDGESVRYYMATRMPQYHPSHLGELPSLLARVDVLEGDLLAGKEMNLPSPESRSESERQGERLLRAGGQELLGDKGLNCVACHSFNGKSAEGTQGMDLLTAYPRLQPAYFNSYLRGPSAFRPRTVMPTAWPDGVATHNTILDGNTDMQIEAIWYYLSLGTSAADPSGIRSVSTVLTVEDQAQTYRGRSRVAGFRGIAVGLPEKLNYAFNAETGTLTAIWQGGFVHVNWSGQGAGDFNPITRPITLVQDVSFAKLADEKAPWPLLPVMTREARTNPDPLYPKNVGYQFLGYALGESSIPTFMYRSGDIAIEDRSVARGSEGAQHLQRTLQFESPQEQTVWFRGLTGEIRRESERVFRSGDLRLTIPECETNIRSLPDQPGHSELLLRLDIPQGTSTVELLYEPLQN
jgi:mono/diheme cytochrome c family protein